MGLVLHHLTCCAFTHLDVMSASLQRFWPLNIGIKGPGDRHNQAMRVNETNNNRGTKYDTNVYWVERHCV